MTTAIVIILLAVAMMVGPLMLMRPSPSQTRVAKLRNAAQQTGLRIRMDRSPFAEKAPQLAVYMLPFAKEDTAAAERPVFSLFRKNFVHDIHFNADWDWYKQGEVSQQQVQNLRSFLSGLDKTIVGVECSKTAVGLYWRERSLSGESDEQSVQHILRELQNLKRLCQP